MAKNFKKLNNPAYNFIDVPTVQEVQEIQEVQDVQETQKPNEEQEAQGTQGRKGKKLPRMNMAFYGENLSYINKMARINGVTATAYINSLIDADKEKNKEIIEKLENLLK